LPAAEIDCCIFFLKFFFKKLSEQEPLGRDYPYEYRRKNLFQKDLISCCEVI
jgi:hypothetical protein